MSIGGSCIVIDVIRKKCVIGVEGNFKKEVLKLFLSIIK